MKEKPAENPMKYIKSTPTTRRNGRSHLYSLYKKAMAPLWIISESSRTREIFSAIASSDDSFSASATLNQVHPNTVF